MQAIKSKRVWAAALMFVLVPLPAFTETFAVALIEYPPFESNPAKENGRWGYMPEVIREIFGKQGIDVKFDIVPWARAIHDTENGTYDALPLVNSGHSKLLVLSKERTAVLKQMFYVKKGNPWHYNGLASLDAITVGWVLGYDYSTFSQEYQQYIEKYRDNPGRILYTAGDTAPADMFKKILAGRVTTFNEDQTFFHYIMSRGGIGRVQDFDVVGTLGENVQYMGFSPVKPSSTRYAALFDQGLRELRESGKLKSILDSYGITDWQDTNGD